MIQRRQGISLTELQETLGVSKKELQTDLNAILLCGTPPYHPHDYISVHVEGDRVMVDFADHFARPARLTLQEALALRMALERLGVDEDGPLGEAYLQLLETLERATKSAYGESIASLEGRIEAPKAQDMAGKLTRIDEAIAGEIPLEIAYYSASSGRAGRRVVHPYGRGDRHGNHYLIAHCAQANDLRSFRLDRISKLDLRPDVTRVAPPEGFDLEAHLESIGPRPGQGGFPVTLRFDPGIARYAEEDHAGHPVRREDGGAVVVERHVGSTPWAVSHALGYGEEAEIEGPPEARDELVRRLEAFLEG